MQKQYKAGLGCIGILLALFVLVMTVAIRNKPTPEQEAASAAEKAGYAAASACEVAVRAQLKAPATAEFQAPRRAAITKYADGYKVVSYVDAANSFGAKLRTPYTCLAEADGAGFKVVGLEMARR